MIILFVDDSANSRCQNRVKGAEQVNLQRGDAAFQYNNPEVFDVAVDGIAQEKPLHGRRKCINLVEDGGQIHQQHGKNIVQVGDIPKEYKKRGENQANSDVEHNQTADGIEKRQEMNADGNLIQQHKQEKNTQRQPKIDKR